MLMALSLKIPKKYPVKSPKIAFVDKPTLIWCPCQEEPREYPIHVCTKTIIIGLHFVASCMGLASFEFLQCMGLSWEDASFLSAFGWPFKPQGHSQRWSKVDDFGTNWKRVSDFLLIAVRHGSAYTIVRAMNAETIWRHAPPCRSVTDCKMNDLEWPWVAISCQNLFLSSSLLLESKRLSVKK